MLHFIYGDWESNEEHFAVVKRLVLETVRIFGSHRVMFASNFPVEKFLGTTLTRLFTSFARIASDLPSEADRANLFSGAARAAYRL